MKKIISTLLLGTLLSIGGTFHVPLFSHTTVYAQASSIPQVKRPITLPGFEKKDSNQNEFNTQDAGNKFLVIVGNFLKIFLGIIGMIAVFFVTYGGLRIALAGGNDDSRKAGLDVVKYAIIGLFMSATSYAIVDLVSKIPAELIKAGS